MLTNILKAILSIFITPPVADAGDYRRSKTAVAVMVIIAVPLVGLVIYSLITHNPLYAAIYLTAIYWLPQTVGEFIYTHDVFRRLKDNKFCIEFLAKEGCITYSLMKKFCNEYPTKFFWDDKGLWTNIFMYLMKSCDYNHKPEAAIKYVKKSKIKYDCLRFSDEASERLYGARKIITVVGTTISIFSAAFGNLFSIGLTGIYRTIGIIMMFPVPLLTILICYMIYRALKSHYALKIAVPDVTKKCLRDKSFSEMVLRKLDNEPLYDYVYNLREIAIMGKEEQIGSL